MQLKLRIAGKTSAELGTAVEHVFDETGGTVGRAAANDWVLPDPRRVLSSRHAIITFGAGSFTITDTSTNGVFVGDETEPLGRGNARLLRHGDRLVMGDWRIDIALEETLAPRSPAPPMAPARAATPGSLGAPSEPLAAPEGGQALRRRQPIVLGDLGATMTSPAPSAGAAPLAAAGVAFPAILPPDFQPLGTAAPAASLGPGRGGLPDDWHSVLEDLVPAPPKPAIWEEPRTRFAPTPPRQPAAQPAIAPATVVAPRAVVLPDPLPPAALVDILPRDAVPEEIAPPTVSAAAAEFFKAAGLDRGEPSETEFVQAMREAGEALRLAADGIVGVLAGRKLFKNEIRVANTTLRPVENNAFKFSPSGQAALAKLLGKRDPGYLPLAKAIAESFDDIKAHEIAVVAAIDAAIRALLDRLNPKTLQARLAIGDGGSRGAKTRYWDAFTESYEALAGNAADTFHEVFGEEFGEVYAEQIERMRSSGGRA
ncbi:MAG TPA: type VI secretion system-associated FHA domain protein TagH [Stellaceae bacterium]|nr:type VI secretion system-associated FHA domain protein TagH [Stellaceae bacterium]